VIGCISKVGSDIYTPSIPSIAIDLHTKMRWAQASLSIYMLAMACAMLVFGPLADIYGRKKTLIAGFIIVFIGAIVSACAHTITTLMIGRVIQGIGAGAGGCLWRAIFRDRFSGPTLAKYGSYLSIFVVLVIPAAPLLGGYLEHYIHWQASFIFLSVYALVAIALIHRTYEHIPQLYKPDRCIRSHFRELLTDRVFMGYGLCVFITYGAFYAWFVVSPVLLIHYLHMSAVRYGWMTFGMGATAMLMPAKSMGG
jgi:DHA1 family bicyclomycin/chloramphenicol resistance-like MFS transporter/DHA1 family 2-module integral membrane pump EmrD-like MFS transporter